MRDSANNMQVKSVIASISGAASDAAIVGAIIDRQGYDSLTYLINIGVVADADATFAVLLEEGDAANLSDAAAVADADMIGTEAAAGFQFDDDGEVRKLGYIGNKRYTRMTITPATNTGAWPIGVLAVLERAEKSPVVQAAS